MPSRFTSLVNCRLCRDGELVQAPLVISNETGCFVDGNGYVGTDAIDLQGAIVAPGFIELQTNGLRGFHFTHYQDAESYTAALDRAAAYLPSQGVTAFYATLPTIPREDFKKILPALRPRDIPGAASLLGAHTEGPYLHPSKKGAHEPSLFQPATVPPVDIYGPVARSSDTIKLVTLAPELEGSTALIRDLTQRGIRVALGHSNATFAQGREGIEAGATCLTHCLNAMAPLHHRDPGLAGLVAMPSSTAARPPYFSLIPDGHHLHPSVVALLFRADPARCVLITDSIELAGLDDGTYPGHRQIPHNQTKRGSRVVVEGTDTLIGGCASLAECVQNLLRWTGCAVPHATRCVSENIVRLMGDGARGRLESGRRADFVVLDDGANVLQTWIRGRKVFQRQ